MKVLLIDDDRLITASLKIILEADSQITVVGTGEDGTEAVTLYEELHPDILLLDIRMKEMSGLTAGSTILKKNPSAKIIYLTTFSDDEYIVKALHLGAKGYVLKQDFETLIPALKAVMSGQSVFGQDVVSRLPGLINDKQLFSHQAFDLSEKEGEIIEAVAGGLSNREIAEALCLSEGTVRNYISTVLDKLGLRDRTQLAIFYYKNIQNSFK